MGKIFDRLKDKVVGFLKDSVSPEYAGQKNDKTRGEKYLELMETFTREYGFQNRQTFPVPPSYPDPDLLVRLPLDTARELQDKFWLESIQIYEIWIKRAEIQKMKARELLESIGEDDIYEAKYFKNILKRMQDSADYTLRQAEREIEFCKKERNLLSESFDEHTARLVTELTQLRTRALATGKDFDKMIDEHFSTLETSLYSEESLALAKLIVLGRGTSGTQLLPN